MRIRNTRRRILSAKSTYKQHSFIYIEFLHIRKIDEKFPTHEKMFLIEYLKGDISRNCGKIFMARNAHCAGNVPTELQL
jgi:hypothetical protein